MSLEYVPPNVPSLIISTGVLFAPKSIYNASLPSNTELFNQLTVSSLLIPDKIHLKSTPFTFNIATFLTHKQPLKHHDIYYKHAVQI